MYCRHITFTGEPVVVGSVLAVGHQGECPCRMSDRGPLRVGSSGSVSEFSFIAEEFWHLHWNTYSGYRFIPNLEKSLKIQPVIRM